MPSIPSCLEIIFRALFVTSAMGATSFVVGSVVSYQYHLVLIHFKWEDDEAVESKYRKLARKVYVVGFVIGLIVAMGIDHMKSSPLYYLILGAAVCLFWVIWAVLAYYQERDRILKRGVRWEWWVSSASLALVSASIGATFICQWFQWVGLWKNALKW